MMGIAKDQFEPGAIFEGPFGQLKEIIKIEDGFVFYRVAREAFQGRPKLKEDQEKKVKIATFRDWARKEIA